MVVAHGHAADLGHFVDLLLLLMDRDQRTLNRLSSGKAELDLRGLRRRSFSAGMLGEDNTVREHGAHLHLLDCIVDLLQLLHCPILPPQIRRSTLEQTRPRRRSTPLSRVHLPGMEFVEVQVIQLKVDEVDAHAATVPLGKEREGEEARLGTGERSAKVLGGPALRYKPERRGRTAPGLERRSTWRAATVH